jgi:ATP-dependent Clp protease ATP-binding subunit ClpB
MNIAGSSRQLDPNRRSKLVEDFERSLRRRIVGQDPAIDALVNIYQMFTAGLNPVDRPIGNLLFLGPTGTGKTRVPEAAAEILFGSPYAVLKVDCAEFQHGHEIAKLIGSPPGYLGHRETHPLFTQENINKYHTETLRLTFILFDEIEKASDTLWQLILGVLDKGILTLGDNRMVDFSQCVIIMTSNVGAMEMSKLTDGYGFSSSKTAAAAGHKQVETMAMGAAKKKFSPEFMNRIDKSVVFQTLQREHLAQILELELEAVQARILHSAGNAQFLYECTPTVKEHILREGTDLKYGARHLKRAIERTVVFPLSNLVATDQILIGDKVVIGLEDTEFTFNVVENALIPVLLAKYSSMGITLAKRIPPPPPELEDEELEPIIRKPRRKPRKKPTKDSE